MVAGADLRLGLIRQRGILGAIHTTGCALYNAAHQPAHSPQLRIALTTKNECLNRSLLQWKCNPSCGLIAEASRLRHPGACSRHPVARRPPIPVSESQAIRLPYRVAVYVELTRPTYRAHHTGDSWLLVIRLPPRLLRCGCYMMFHLFVVSGSGQPAGFAIGWAYPSQDSRRLPSSR